MKRIAGKRRGEGKVAMAAKVRVWRPRGVQSSMAEEIPPQVKLRDGGYEGTQRKRRRWWHALVAAFGGQRSQGLQ